MAFIRKQKLRVWRERQRLSLRDVSDLTGFSQSMLSLVERGQRQLSVRGKIVLARRLDVGVGELFDAEPVPEVDLLQRKA